MAAVVSIDYSVSVADAQGIHIEQRQRCRFSPPGTGLNGKRETVTVTASAFTALAPPAGAKGLFIVLGGATGLTLKGVTGDTGIVLEPPPTPPPNPITAFDVMMPLGPSPSIGLASTNTANQTVECIWV